MLIGSAALKPTLASGLHPTSREQARAALKEACEEFEAILVRQMVQSARAASPEGLVDEEAAAGMVEDVHDDFLSEALGQSRGLGLGKLLFDSLVRQVELTCRSEGDRRRQAGCQILARPPTSEPHLLEAGMAPAPLVNRT